MSTLDVDPEGLGKGGDALDEAGDKLKVIREEYVDRITHYRGCWGTGEFGEAFAKKYYEGLDPCVEGVDALSAAVKGSANSLKRTGANFRKTQDDIHSNTSGRR
ncbi:hypothetical protein [Streptomyces clavuligerus]|uniref:WXG100 family type VII secretion target n=1 Tax=Streptomyces clavuligerus TaxID=1901 RepID=B5GVR2_STRCL|nr:hypothetical protein [Streptomyces clavuligerus]EDY50408.1 hypothetical protein SSCG_03555 [Streptomyces clavuligerus]EFG03547.1 Hypothetical protein SCLAV_p0052 [Streptomyces clavuligerus]MBY6307871.1 hypothetical protein [Streptomyces clavuligerus]QCS09575.1 hypothetical protein CRV15_28395 [Streptomyces clavuligerus]QPJ98373.1 hypothetical protein GE265_35910 [Streptomyces clavuligerus]